MSSEVGEGLREHVAERAYRVCEYCLVHEDDLFHDCEVDHIISLKHGGATGPENLAYACFHCNRHKGTDVGSIASKTGQFTRFFNPRSDRWESHFYVNGGRIEPLSDIGEVTCRVLEFNHPERVLQRSLLAEAGRYPTVEALARMKG
ncbi:MAG: HNH endonuclease [Verrucomicrobia bacterium]|nr:HNH endonuclease [Verrucomicrobiota bacterium]